MGLAAHTTQQSLDLWSWLAGVRVRGEGTSRAHRVCGLGDCDARGRPNAGAAKRRRAGSLAGVHRRANARQDVGCNLQYEGC